MPPCSGRSRPSLAVAANAASLDRPCARRLRDRWPGRKNGPRRSRTKEWTYAISAIVISVMKKIACPSHPSSAAWSDAVRKGHVGEHISLGLVEEAGKFGQLGAELVGDLAPLGSRGLGVVLGKRCGDEGGDDAPPALAGMRPARCA